MTNARAGGRRDRPQPRVARAPAGPGLAARDAAVRLLAGVLDRRHPLDQLLDPVLGDPALRPLSQPDRALARALVATALRRHGQIADALGRLIERPLPRRAGPLRRILEIGATQLLFLGIPDHAAVSTAVDLAEADPDARHFKGLANGVLRALARGREQILAGQDAARLNTPAWLFARWSAAYGEPAARRIAESHLSEPPLDLSVKADAAGWAERLGGTVLPTGGVRLRPEGPVDALPGFAEGGWWVQDAAAALPAQLLGPVAGRRVADLCAAPGGKTAQLAAAGATVTAVDLAAGRLARLADNLARLGLAAERVEADLRRWRPDEPFDAVLLDAPCSATGTIRRHPDVAWLKSEAQIAALAGLQGELLDRAASILRPGGTLVYATCSLEPEEGEAQADAAPGRLPLTPMPLAEEERTGFALSPGRPHCLRILPDQLAAADPRLAGLGGFFIARFRRAA